jgi:hypothetical protein
VAAALEDSLLALLAALVDDVPGVWPRDEKLW